MFWDNIRLAFSPVKGEVRTVPSSNEETVDRVVTMLSRGNIRLQLGQYETKDELRSKYEQRNARKN